MNEKLREAKQAFEKRFRVPDFLDFDGEDYMYYGEDPVLEYQCRNTTAQWRGFSSCYRITLNQPKHETVDQWEDRTGDIYPNDGLTIVWSNYRIEYQLYRYYAVKSTNSKNKIYVIDLPIVTNHHGKPEEKNNDR
jgi:hypothetical protein